MPNRCDSRRTSRGAHGSTSSELLKKKSRRDGNRKKAFKEDLSTSHQLEIHIGLRIQGRKRVKLQYYTHNRTQIENEDRPIVEPNSEFSLMRTSCFFFLEQVPDLSQSITRYFYRTSPCWEKNVSLGAFRFQIQIRRVVLAFLV